MKKTTQTISIFSWERVILEGFTENVVGGNKDKMVFFKLD